MEKIQITTPGIKRALRRYSIPKAIAEFVWNGFDAKASKVEIKIESNAVGFIEAFTIIDNGYGIPSEDLKSKFKPFFESEKEIDPDIQRETSAVHGKNGVGRLTFFTFADHAQWDTTYERNGQRYKYSIEISSNELETYKVSSVKETNEPVGTRVTFTGIREITAYDFETDILDFLRKEFGWFLELNKSNSYSIAINGNVLDYSPLIGDRDAFVIDVDGQEFNIGYVRWNEFISEYSRYYFIDAAGNEKFKKTTTLNNKGDSYYHSVYVQSSFFNTFNGPLVRDDGDRKQGQLFSSSENEKIFRKLMEQVNQFLRDKRRPFLKAYADKIIDAFVEDNAFPVYSNDPWDKFRREELESVMKELYQVEPRIFSKLNVEQKRTFAHLLDLVIDSGERDRLLKIIDEIVRLEPDEREQFAEILKSSSLSNVVKTIRLIEDRYRAIDELKSLVYSRELRANEPQHIQKFVEKHYWIFGEQYHLVTAAEPKFEKALRRYIYLLRGEKSENVSIDHPDKHKEMDIFMVRQDVQNDAINNVVVELKNPRVRLGAKELNQVKTYLGVIMKQEEFNASNMHWDFILVGNAFDTSGYIEAEIENAKHHGERSLVFKNSRYKIYVRTWSEIFADFEIRHKFLNEKLQLRRKELMGEYPNADTIIENIDANTAVQPPEIKIPE